MDMKLRGMYIARQLSFKGVTFQIEEVPFDEESEKTYNDSVELVSFRTLATIVGTCARCFFFFFSR